jgi:hypothetical protein
LALKKDSIRKRESRKFVHIGAQIKENAMKMKSANPLMKTVNTKNNLTEQNYSDNDNIYENQSAQQNCDLNDEFSADNNEIIVDEPVSLSKKVYDLDFKSFLRIWAIKFNVQRNALSDLLRYLKKIDSDLPLDSRTLLRTPRTVDLMTVFPGKYIHFPLINEIELLLSKSESIPQELKINLNVDGVPIYKDTFKCPAFWIIQGKFLDFDEKPFIIGCYGGETKPKLFNNFLEPTIKELKSLRHFTFNNNKIDVKLNKIMLDAPAKSYVLNTIGHNGYYSCPKCEVEGTYIENKMSFYNINAPLRTNESFRKKSNEEHHHPGSTIIEELDYFDMVNDVVIDYMHAVLLGVTKKLLKMWFIETGKYKLSNVDKNKASKVIESINVNIPNEFQRSLRDLNFISHFKATECRQFLLFHGIIALKDVVDRRIYQHFLKFHIAIKILCDRKFYVKFNHIAQILIDDFIEEFKIIYGEKEIIHNVHLLHHVPHESLRNGPLDDYSCFPFENNMTQFKKLIHTTTNPLQQLYNRFYEYNALGNLKLYLDDENNSENKNKLIINNCVIDNSEKNCYILLKNGSIFKYGLSLMNSNGNLELQGKIFLKSQNVYDFPIASKSLDIHGITKIETVDVKINLKECERKMFCVNTNFTKDNGECLIKIFFPL